MCGIAGIYNFGKDNPVSSELLKRMTDIIKYRGPDDEGFYISPQRELGLGHRRLSIIDLETGHQPLSNEDKSIWIVHSGEVYNFLELRKELKKKYVFKTKSDTEVILRLYEEKGVDCVRYLRGMFAFAIWDEKKELLFLARDRVGQKPLVYFKNNSKFIFASEIKSILEDKDIRREVNIGALYNYISLGYVPSPDTMFEDIYKLPPAHIMTCRKGEIKTKRYWELDYNDKLELTEPEYEERLLHILKEATKLQLISDVPLGALLSGGVDSSFVVYMMSQIMKNPVKTFTIGFHEKPYSELKYAKIVAEHSGTEHHEFVVEPDAINILPKLIWHYNEPFADSSSIPSYYVCRATKDYVKVALNGDGGDESFAGYERYLGILLTSHMDKMPPQLYKAVIKAIEHLNFLWGPQRKLRIQKLCKAISHYRNPVKRYEHWVCCFSDGEEDKLYSAWVRNWKENTKPLPKVLTVFEGASANDFIDKAFYFDIFCGLAEGLTAKIEIAGMANSLETRSPFLDHHLMEFAAKTPLRLKMKHFSTKYILKKTLAKKVPPKAFYREKQGFAIPIGKWFRTSWKHFIYKILIDEEQAIHIYFNKDYVKKILDEHISGKSNNDFKIWALLNFELWYRQFILGS